MKFEDFLMEPNEERQKKKLDLQDEVVKLHVELNGEKELSKALQWALHVPLFSNHPLSPSLPPQVQVIIEEMKMLEEEINRLERKVEDLKVSLYKEREIQQHKIMFPKQNLFLCGPENTSSVLNSQRSRSQNYDELRKDRMIFETRFSSSSASDISREINEQSKRKPARSRDQSLSVREIVIENPNELSEELVKCLIGIYLDLNRVISGREGSPINSKHGISCISSSKRSLAKTSFSCKSPQFTLSFNNCMSDLDPYNLLPDMEGSVRDVGPYKNFIQITRTSLDIGRYSECLPAIQKSRVLMHKLSNVDLTFLTYKQKLAFWINIYNASIMHAFLELGLPSTPDKLLALMNKAALNIGGIVLNALAIEHFILRHPGESKHPADEKEMLLRQTYGLGYPEPNVTFALCRGNWSSPALRVYTSEGVVNELGRAKVEYLEASIGLTSKKKIVVPKLLQWNMRDFADDMESLLEWIYSQLPRSSLKASIMECLNGELKSPLHQMIEIQPYQSEFRYLLSV